MVRDETVGRGRVRLEERTDAKKETLDTDTMERSVWSRRGYSQSFNNNNNESSSSSSVRTRRSIFAKRRIGFILSTRGGRRRAKSVQESFLQRFERGEFYTDRVEPSGDVVGRASER